MRLCAMRNGGFFICVIICVVFFGAHFAHASSASAPVAPTTPPTATEGAGKSDTKGGEGKNAPCGKDPNEKKDASGVEKPHPCYLTPGD